MSRSYRLPIITDGYKTNWRPKMKKFANRRVRKHNCYNYGYYKKMFNAWDICDYKFDYRWSQYDTWWPKWKMIRK